MIHFVDTPRLLRFRDVALPRCSQMSNLGAITEYQRFVSAKASQALTEGDDLNQARFIPSNGFTKIQALEFGRSVFTAAKDDLNK